MSRNYKLKDLQIMQITSTSLQPKYRYNTDYKCLTACELIQELLHALVTFEETQ